MKSTLISPISYKVTRFFSRLIQQMFTVILPISNVPETSFFQTVQTEFTSRAPYSMNIRLHAWNRRWFRWCHPKSQDSSPESSSKCFPGIQQYETHPKVTLRVLYERISRRANLSAGSVWNLMNKSAISGTLQIYPRFVLWTYPANVCRAFSTTP